MSWAQIATRILVAFLRHPATQATARYALRQAAAAGLRYLRSNRVRSSVTHIS